jgi:multidrug resistance efflux pump
VLAQKQLDLANVTWERDKSLGRTVVVSQQQLDQDKAMVEEADARVKVAQAALKTATSTSASPRSARRSAGGSAATTTRRATSLSRTRRC